jgi:hypothetical protein
MNTQTKPTSSWTIGAFTAFIIAALAAIPYMQYPAGLILTKFIVNWAIYAVIITAVVEIYRKITKRRA